MNIHLIRDKEYDIEQFSEVVQFLNSFEGPVKFIPSAQLIDYETDIEWKDLDEEEFFKQVIPDFVLENHCFVAHFAPPKGRYVVSCESLFKICSEYKRWKRIDNQELVLLLTPQANEFNWFCMLDPKDRNNGFIHTADWGFYVHCPSTYPIAYHIASLVLQCKMFKDVGEQSKSWHPHPLGCINDLCENKKDVLLKLRTADICSLCLEHLKDKIEPLALQQMLNVFEGVRQRILFNRKIRENQKLSTLNIKCNKKIYLMDYGNLEIKLTPLERTLYLFFLKHPEGIMLHDLVDHREELKSIYAQLSTSGILAEIHNRIESLVDVRSNSASEKISKIKTAFENAIGCELARHYIIKGENRQVRKIELDRSLIIE